QHQHQRRQPVQHQRDAERQRPVGSQVDGGVVLPVATVHGDQQPQRHRQRRQHAGDVDRKLQPVAALVDQHQHRGGGQRQQDRQDDGVLLEGGDQGGDEGAHGSSPS